MVSVNKASWDEGGDFKENHAFNRRWIRMCRRVLKPGGTIWISGTLHNIYSIGMALQQERYKIINNITWKKTNPPPNLACRCFTHSTATILWARKDDKKARHLFNYEPVSYTHLDVYKRQVMSPAGTAVHESLLTGIASTIYYYVVGLVFCVLGYLALNLINRKYDLNKEISGGNPAAGIMVAGMFIGLSIIISGVIM